MNCKNCNVLLNQSLSQKQFVIAFGKKYKTILPEQFSINEYCRNCLEMIEEDLKQELITKNNNYQVDFINKEGLINIDYFGNRNTFVKNYEGFINSNLSDGVYILQPNSIECQAICRRFTSPEKILFIEKNINRELYNTFYNSIGDGRLVNLFHGSSNDNFDSILKKGLLIEKSSKGLLGIGIYGAENSLYSLSFSRSINVNMTSEIKDALVNKKYTDTKEPIKIKAMLLCDFILTNESKNLDCTASGIIHAVYANKYVYPGYLIYFDSG